MEFVNRSLENMTEFVNRSWENIAKYVSRSQRDIAKFFSWTQGKKSHEICQSVMEKKNHEIYQLVTGEIYHRCVAGNKIKKFFNRSGRKITNFFSRTQKNYREFCQSVMRRKCEIYQSTAINIMKFASRSRNLVAVSKRKILGKPWFSKGGGGSSRPRYSFGRDLNFLDVNSANPPWNSMKIPWKIDNSDGMLTIFFIFAG